MKPSSLSFTSLPAGLLTSFASTTAGFTGSFPVITPVAKGGVGCDGSATAGDTGSATPPAGSRFEIAGSDCSSACTGDAAGAATSFAS